MTNILLFVFGCISGYGIVSIAFAAKKGMGFILSKYTHDVHPIAENKPVSMIGSRRGFGSVDSKKIIRKRRGFGAKKNID